MSQKDLRLHSSIIELSQDEKKIIGTLKAGEVLKMLGLYSCRMFEKNSYSDSCVNSILNFVMGARNSLNPNFNEETGSDILFNINCRIILGAAAGTRDSDEQIVEVCGAVENTLKPLLSNESCGNATNEEVTNTQKILKNLVELGAPNDTL